MRAILASRSPRRRVILRSLGFDVVVKPADVDETPMAGETPAACAERLAAAKACALEPLPAGSIGVGADTVVMIDGRILGKPLDPQDARDMLVALSDRRHSVITGLAVRHGNALLTGSAVTLVTFQAMTALEVDLYVETGEPLDKAGAYGIQGLGGLFIDRIEGSPTNVIGLPVHLLYRLLGKLGLGQELFHQVGAGG